MNLELRIALARGDWTLADEMALAQLSEATQDLFARALAFRHKARVVEDAEAKGTTLKEAFDEGWRAAMRQIEGEIDLTPWRNPYAKRG